MILLWFIIILMAGGVVAWIAGNKNKDLARWISLAALLIDFVLAIVVWIESKAFLASSSENWIADYKINWIPTFGVSFHLAMDGLALLMLILTFFLGIMAVLTSW